VIDSLSPLPVTWLNPTEGPAPSSNLDSSIPLTFCLPADYDALKVATSMKHVEKQLTLNLSRSAFLTFVIIENDG